MNYDKDTPEYRAALVRITSKARGPERGTAAADAAELQAALGVSSRPRINYGPAPKPAPTMIDRFVEAAQMAAEVTRRLQPQQVAPVAPAPSMIPQRRHDPTASARARIARAARVSREMPE